MINILMVLPLIVFLNLSINKSQSKEYVFVFKYIII